MNGPLIVKQPHAEAEAMAYLYDGSLEGLLTAVFASYERRQEPDEVVPEASYQPRLGQESLVVETDFEKALRVRRGVEKATVQKAKDLDDQRKNVVDIVQNLTAIAEENAASTEETTASTAMVSGIMVELTDQSNNLKTVSEKLEELVSVFNVG